jgi:hypothetical protein
MVKGKAEGKATSNFAREFDDAEARGGITGITSTDSITSSPSKNLKALALRGCCAPLLAF